MSKAGTKRRGAVRSTCHSCGQSGLRGRVVVECEMCATPYHTHDCSNRFSAFLAKVDATATPSAKELRLASSLRRQRTLAQQGLHLDARAGGGEGTSGARASTGAVETNGPFPSGSGTEGERRDSGHVTGPSNPKKRRRVHREAGLCPICAEACPCNGGPIPCHVSKMRSRNSTFGPKKKGVDPDDAASAVTSACSHHKAPDLADDAFAAESHRTTTGFTNSPRARVELRREKGGQSLAADPPHSRVDATGRPLAQAWVDGADFVTLNIPLECALLDIPDALYWVGAA